MKKFKFISILLLTALLSACANVDVNLAREDNVYDEMADFINSPEEYVGKTVRLTATCVPVYSFVQNKILRYSLIESSPSGASRVLYEIRTEDEKYPIPGSKTTVFGRFCEGNYILVESFEKVETDSRSFEIDTLDMSADELTQFIRGFCSEYNNSDHYEKQVRIFGHCVVRNGYYYLLGLNEKGSMTWSIELYDPNNLIVLPESESTELNPVEIVGCLKIYMENNIAYACIEVESIACVSGTFS